MKICPKCGRRYVDTHLRCPDDGTPLQDAPLPIDDEEDTTVVDERIPEPNELKLEPLPISRPRIGLTKEEELEDESTVPLAGDEGPTALVDHDGPTKVVDEMESIAAGAEADAKAADAAPLPPIADAAEVIALAKRRTSGEYIKVGKPTRHEPPPQPEQAAAEPTRPAALVPETAPEGAEAEAEADEQEPSESLVAAVSEMRAVGRRVLDARAEAQAASRPAPEHSSVVPLPKEGPLPEPPAAPPPADEEAEPDPDEPPEPEPADQTQVSATAGVVSGAIDADTNPELALPKTPPEPPPFAAELASPAAAIARLETELIVPAAPPRQVLWPHFAVVALVAAGLGFAAGRLSAPEAPEPTAAAVEAGPTVPDAAQPADTRPPVPDQQPVTPDLPAAPDLAAAPPDAAPAPAVRRRRPRRRHRPRRRQRRRRRPRPSPAIVPRVPAVKPPPPPPPPPKPKNPRKRTIDPFAT